MTLKAALTPLGRFGKFSDILTAVGVVGVVVMMIIPVPPAVLDLLLTFNITLTLIILLVSMYIDKPLQFSIFPSMLLVVTLFRLGLNVTGTRLVLLHAYAGEVINAFGNFVVGGNYVVGMVVFIILIVIQFVVVTNGAQRVAEVAARFTLDAMPGKQMSIDADFNAGLIDESETKRRRNILEREADFYGAMDGASKFIRGDAIAALIIVLVNIFGGFIIGVIQKGMSLTQALQTYTLLTVGEGLVTQIPALLVSTATGIVITRAASEGNLGEEMTTQLLARPRALAIAAGLLLFFAAVPGLPKLPFIMMGVAVGILSYALQQRADSEEKKQKEEEDVKAPESFTSLLELDPMELEIGMALIPLVNPQQGGDLLGRITRIRKQCATEMGLIVPPIRVRDSLTVDKNAYFIKIYGAMVARGDIMPGKVLAILSGRVAEKIDGLETREPTFGLPALWVEEEMKQLAETRGYTVVDPMTLITTHLFEVVRSHADELLSRQDVQRLMDRLKPSHQVVLEELIPGVLGVGEIQKVLQNLLKERVSIRNMVVVLETLANKGKTIKDPDLLTEYVRQALARTICQQHQIKENHLGVITLDPRLEMMITEAIKRSEKDAYAAIDPHSLRKIYKSLLEEVQKVSNRGLHPVVLCSPGLRMHFKRLTERVIPYLTVLSYAEVIPEMQVESFGMITIDTGTPPPEEEEVG
ncbi:MAG: flagellar biosynthesis protein FlhA [bacterium]